MKNQYFGDLHDYRKYGLLRCFLRTGINLHVCWMLTPDDTSRDGRRLNYADDPDFRPRDPHLFDQVSRWVKAGVRSVTAIEQSSLLGSTTYSSETIPDTRALRDPVADRMVDAGSGADMVFLDPDNGIEVPSVGYGRKNSSKHVFLDEVRRIADNGSAVLIYQHFPREATARTSISNSTD